MGYGGEERKGILFVFFCLYISEMSTQLGFFISPVLMSKTKKECIAFEPLVSWFNNRLICMIRVKHPNKLSKGKWMRGFFFTLNPCCV